MRSLPKEILLKYGVWIVAINLWIIPIVIWIIWDFNYALSYFWRFSLGIPYIIFTIGSFWYYDASKKGNQQIESLNRRIENARKLAAKGRVDQLNKETSRRDKKINEVNRSIYIKESCDRLCYILRIGAIVLAMYFFLNPGNSTENKISSAIENQNNNFKTTTKELQLDINELKKTVETQKLEIEFLKLEQEKINSPKNSKY